MNNYGDSFDKIKKMSYGFFSDTACTPEILNQFLDMVEILLDDCGCSRDEAYLELERLHNIAILDSSAILEDHNDHIEWFNPTLNTGLKRDINWHFWTHYKDYLSIGKNWAKGVIDSIDQETSAVLSRLEDPQRNGEWARYGMVMGSVQSGKTANYTGLISKAIDAGYKLIVVLAGVHNSLRSQTQYRLNEEILGYDLDKVEEFRGQAARIGVRGMFHDHAIVQTLTSSSESGDFKKKIAEMAGIIPTHNGPATIMIVKKHVSILKYLTDWATSIIGIEDDSGRRIVTDVPLLVIDDECDYASVDTKKKRVDEDGNVDEECDPAKTNMRIRELLCAFHKRAYVGYTATPFANIFIHHKHRHPKYGKDLFPQNFIISLPQPANYIGPERVFGLTDNPAVGIEGQDPLPLLRKITDSEGLIPGKHKADLSIRELPDSLKKAIKVFLLSCAVRKIRKSKPYHNSMLVHVTRYTDVQHQIHQLVEKELRKYVARIQNRNDCLLDFHELWESDFIETSDKMREDFGCPNETWDSIIENLYSVARRVKVKAINGTAKDSLDYRRVEMEAKRLQNQGESITWEECGEHVIAIGGDKLSRGLTLDGLTVSYYLRASRMYDTLMQMGRWFGYRDGYADLCRIYTTTDLMDWYRFIATASVELRRELEYMALIGEEPKSFGLKVLSHPGQLAITSAGKRRNAEKLNLSYSGRISETIVFDLSLSAVNTKAAQQLLNSINKEGNLSQNKTTGTLHATGISPDIIIQFLNTYKTQAEAARVVDPDKIALFIEEQLKHSDNDLTTWDVAVISRQDPPKIWSTGIDGIKIGCVERRPLTLDRNDLTIRRLVSPSDEWIDFSEKEKELAMQKWIELRLKKGKPVPEPGALPSGPAIREARPKNRGLLLIYTICFSKNGHSYGMKDGEEVTGFAVSFPSSNTTRQVLYEVNSVYQDAEE